MFGYRDTFKYLECRNCGSSDLRDIPLKSPKSYCVNPNESIFSKQEIKRFRETARQLNEKKQGDIATFYIERQ